MRDDGKARLLVFDVETHPTRDEAIIAEITQEALTKEPAKNAAVSIKATWDTELERNRRVKEAIAKTSLDVLLAEPLCVCWKADGATDGISMMGEAEVKDPSIALQTLATVYSNTAGPETIWVGHNVYGYDLSVLLNSWRRFGIRPPDYFPHFVNGRWVGRVFDTMKRAPCHNGLGFVSLDDTCRAYRLGPAKTVLWNGAPMDGSRVAEAFAAGEYMLILEYCMADVAKERELYFVETADDTWGTWDCRDALAEAVQAIEAREDLREHEKAVAIVRLLDAEGMIPRVR